MSGFPFGKQPIFPWDPPPPPPRPHKKQKHESKQETEANKNKKTQQKHPKQNALKTSNQNNSN